LAATAGVDTSRQAKRGLPKLPVLDLMQPDAPACVAASERFEAFREMRRVTHGLTGEPGCDAFERCALVVVAPNARPIERPLAHRARCGGRVNVTIGKVQCVKPPRRISNGEKLRVSGWVALQHHIVPAFT
jgi:hypothetical protein